MSKEIFYLTGFMASGKSTIGPILANTLGWVFLDLDKEIEKIEKKNITEIFKDNGESYFREKETEVLRGLAAGKNSIISLGGGTLINTENRKIVRKSGKLIFLKSSPENIYQRLKHKRDRPVMSFDDEEVPGEEKYITKVESLLNQRIKFYEEADYTIATDHNSIGMTVDKIARVINESIKH